MTPVLLVGAALGYLIGGGDGAAWGVLVGAGFCVAFWIAAIPSPEGKGDEWWVVGVGVLTGLGGVVWVLGEVSGGDRRWLHNLWDAARSHEAGIAALTGYLWSLLGVAILIGIVAIVFGIVMGVTRLRSSLAGAIKRWIARKRRG